MESEQWRCRPRGWASASASEVRGDERLDLAIELRLICCAIEPGRGVAAHRVTDDRRAVCLQRVEDKPHVTRSIGEIHRRAGEAAITARVTRILDERDEEPARTRCAVSPR